jgi:phage major head subunit gpT-like protein
MKLLDRPKLEAAYIVFSTIFDMALTNTPVIYTEISTVIANAGPVNQFNWLDDVPVMQKWLGARQINRLRAEKQTLTTDWFANGIEFDYDDVNEDKLGIVSPRIQMLAQMGPRKIDALVVDMYNNGFAGSLGLTYDGQYLFDTDHTADGVGAGGAQSNLITGALSSTSYNTGIARMMGFVGTNAEPLSIVPDTILAGPSNQLVVRQLLQAQYNAAGASNVDAGTARGIINARITGAHATKWYLMSAAMRVRAVVLGIEVPPMFAELSGWDQMHVFMHRTMLAGGHMKVGTCYGLWQVAVGSQG